MSRDRTSYVDWPRLLGDMQYLLGEPVHVGSSARTPCSSNFLATYLGVKRTTMVGWINGGKIEYHQGCDLIEKWCDLTGKPARFVPITMVSFSAARAL